MAKQSFKDFIFKFLKKDEDAQRGFIVKFAKSKGGKISQAWYRSKADAEKALAMLKKDGVNGIISPGNLDDTMEEAPANATGTAVAGTGDDSSTVVVKKKKKLQKNLMRRMGITEAIDRAIPDLEYPKDEIRERTDQLKQLALESDYEREQPGKVVKAISIARRMAGNYTGATREIEKIARGLSRLPVVKNALMKANEDLNKDDEKTIKPIIKQLKKSVAAHDAQAKQLQKDISDDLDRQPQDKDVKSKPGTQPKKYYKKMSKGEKDKRAAHFAKQKYKKSDDDDDYKAAPGDKDAKTKKSIHTKKFDKMYGKDEMYYGYSTMHAKPVGKLNPLTRKEASDKLKEISLKLKGKVLDRKIKRAKDKVYSKKFLTRP